MKTNPKEFLQKFPKKRIFTIVIVVFALVFSFSLVKDNISCIGGLPVWKKKKDQKMKPAEQPPPLVKVYKLARVSFRDALPSLGTVRGFREYELKFQTSGTVEYINFREGEKITQGDIIASLDQKEALLKLEYSKIELDKQNKLYELGSVLETKLKQSQLEYQSAKVELEKTNLIALGDGYIGSIDVDKGSVITPQEKVGVFVDIKDVYVEFGVIEKDIAKIKEGQNVEVTFDSFPDQVFKGQVESVSPVVEGRSRTIKVKAKLSNPDEKMKSGMFGRVNVLVYEKEDALVIPSSSFKKKENQYFVYLVHAEEPKPKEEAPETKRSSAKKKTKGKEQAPQPDMMPEEPENTFGTVEIRQIEVQYATPDAIEVKEGLEEADLVIVDVEQEFQDKMKVEITETQEGIF